MFTPNRSERNPPPLTSESHGQADEHRRVSFACLSKRVQRLGVVESVGSLIDRPNLAQWVVGGSLAKEWDLIERIVRGEGGGLQASTTDFEWQTPHASLEGGSRRHGPLHPM